MLLLLYAAVIIVVVVVVAAAAAAAIATTRLNCSWYQYKVPCRLIHRIVYLYNVNRQSLVNFQTIELKLGRMFIRITCTIQNNHDWIVQIYPVKVFKKRIFLLNGQTGNYFYSTSSFSRWIPLFGILIE